MAPGVAGTALRLLPLQIVLRAGEAGLPLLIAFWFGRSSATDAYFFQWAFFTFAGSLLFAAFQDSALIPILAQARARHPGELPAIAGSLLGHALLIGGLAATLIGGIAIGIELWRHRGPELALGCAMVPPFSAYLVVFSLRNLCAALLHSEKVFAATPAASGLGITVAIGFSALARARLGLTALPLGLLLGETVALCLLWSILLARGLRPRLTLERPEPVRRFARLVTSEVGGGAVTRLNPIVDQLIAGAVGVLGGGTLLRLTLDVSLLPTSLLQAALLPVLLAHLADQVACANLGRLRETVQRALGWVTLILAAAAALLAAVRRPLLGLLFGHGAMDPGAVARMAEVMPYHLIGLPAFGALLVLARAHVALGNSRIMISMGLLNVGLNAVTGVALAPLLGLRGIALSTSLTHAAVALVFWLRLEARLGRRALPA